MWHVLLEGFLLGLSLGTTCLVTCLPIYLPYLTSEDNSLKRSLLKVLEISAGRFVPYLLFGALTGWLGAFIPPESRILFTGISYLLLSAFLVLNSLRTHREGKSCQASGLLRLTKSPFLLGVITGISFCPSFLMALTRSVDLGGVFNGVILFLGFFFGTSLYLFPLALGGLLTVIGQVKLVARYLSLLIAVWFVWQGGTHLYQVWQESQKTVINPSTADFQAQLYFPPVDSSYAQALADSLTRIYQTKPVVHYTTRLDFPALPQARDKAILFIASPGLATPVDEDSLKTTHHVLVLPGYPIPRIVNFLKTYNFKVKKGNGFHWTFTITDKPTK